MYDSSKYCPRCSGHVISSSFEPECIVCGWQYYGERDDIDSRNVVVKKLSPDRRRFPRIVSDSETWTYDYTWSHPDRQGTVHVQFQIMQNSSGTRKHHQYASAIDIHGLPEKGKHRLYGEMKYAFKNEYGVTLRIS